MGASGYYKLRLYCDGFRCPDRDWTWPGQQPTEYVQRTQAAAFKEARKDGWLIELKGKSHLRKQPEMGNMTRIVRAHHYGVGKALCPKCAKKPHNLQGGRNG